MTSKETRIRRRKWIAALLALPIIWWFVSYPTITGRYKLEVTVNAGGKQHVGSTVYEVRSRWQPDPLPQMAPIITRVRGEALFLDLGKGRNLVVILTATASGRGPQKRGCIPPGCSKVDLSKGSGAMSARALPYAALQIKSDWWWTWLNIRKAREKGKVEIPPSRLPTLVTFSDINDPKSVTLVQPDDLAATFGPGVSLKKATIEVISEPLTRRIEAKLPWLSGLKYSDMLKENEKNLGFETLRTVVVFGLRKG